MAYSKAYQRKVAGRVREDEAFPILRDNGVMAPTGRISYIAASGAVKPETVSKDALEDTQVGKNDDRSQGLDVGKQPPYHV